MSLHLFREGTTSYEEDETFSEVTCPLVQALALLLALVQHSAPANDHPEVVLLPVALA